MALTEIDRKQIDDFLESVKAHGDIVSYEVLADGSCDVVFQPALDNIKIVPCTCDEHIWSEAQAKWLKREWCGCRCPFGGK
jgi:hypothetical protein